MTNHVDEKINEVFVKYEESPKKYCSVIWHDNKKKIMIGDSCLILEKAILVFQEGTQRKMLDASETVDSFVLLCRPKKHMAFVMSDKNRHECHKLFRFGEKYAAEDNNNDESFVCILESTGKCTFIFAYINGLYFLQTFDCELSATLFDVIQTLLEISNGFGREEGANVEKEESEKGLLGQFCKLP